MKMLFLILGFLVGLGCFAQLPEGPNTTADYRSATDSLTIITVQRDPEIDAAITYHSKADPPQITRHAGQTYRNWPDPTPIFSYYELGGERITRSELEQYLGVVDPEAYKDYSRGRELGRRSRKWLYIGLGGYGLALTSSNRDIRRFGLSTLLVGSAVSLGCAIAGSRKRQRGIDRYNRQF